MKQSRALAHTRLRVPCGTPQKGPCRLLWKTLGTYPVLVRQPTMDPCPQVNLAKEGQKETTIVIRGGHISVTWEGVHSRKS